MCSWSYIRYLRCWKCSIRQRMCSRLKSVRVRCMKACLSWNSFNSWSVRRKKNHQSRSLTTQASLTAATKVWSKALRASLRATIQSWMQVKQSRNWQQMSPIALVRAATTQLSDTNAVTSSTQQWHCFPPLQQQHQLTKLITANWKIDHWSLIVYLTN